MTPRRTQVAIVGAGPAGLMLSHLLRREGIDSIVLEQRSLEHVQKRVRAGVLEQGTVDLLVESGVGDRLQREGLVHRGLELRFDRRGHRIPLADLAGGRCITVYGQQEVVKDLIHASTTGGGAIEWEVEDVRLEDLTSDRPLVRYRHLGEERSIACNAVAGCDGFHGVCRDFIPPGHLRVFERDYPFGWVGILAAVRPSTDELIYAFHERGFAMHSLRSPQLSRLYVQCASDDRLEDWPDDRVWAELHARLAADGWSLAEGPVVEKSIALMRSFVVEPMQYGRLFLAGDAAHIVPPTGAKGMNLAMADVKVLACALADWYRTGRRALLDGYSTACLRRVWRAEDFSYWMTSLLHRLPDDEQGFQARLQLSRLRYVVSSRAAATSLAENYVGMVEV